MLLAVAVLGLLGAVAAVVRWQLTRVDALGRVAPFPRISVALGLAVALLAGVPVVRHAQLESRLGAVASALVGHRVTIRCETLSQAWTDAHTELGYVRFDGQGQPETVATITVGACGDLGAWVGSRHEQPPLEQIIAVHVLTHEAMHLAGILDEAAAECAAVQRDERTAQLLGATQRQAVRLALAYWIRVYPDMPDGYQSAECRRGGSLDENLDTAPWAAVKSP